MSDTRTRRRWLGQAAAGCGIGMWPWVRQAGAADASHPAAEVSTKPNIRACIFVFYYGGPSHLDTYDLKPHAPVEIRGEFSPISTSVPGLSISEHLPRMSQWMHRVALVRSMHHTNRLHDSASTETFTGRQGPQGDREEFAPTPQFFPSHGGVVSHALRAERLDVSHAVLPCMFHNVVTTPCQAAGFLGSHFDPFLIVGNPTTLDYSCPWLQLPQDLPPARLARRRDLAAVIGSPTPGVADLESYYSRAYTLLGSETFRKALLLNDEPAAVRAKYGLAPEPPLSGDGAAAGGVNRPLRGQNLLLARRLVEAGVPYVVVNDFRQQGQNWDSHADNFKQNKRYLLPQADMALAALLEDLEERGLLDSTLVVATGEFGRTPRINESAGRDHWPDCYTMLLAGGGVRGGTIFGASDKTGAFPERDPVTPADLAATIYRRFGIDHRTEISDRFGRPWRLADGQPIEACFV